MTSTSGASPREKPAALEYASGEYRPNTLRRSMVLVGWGVFVSTIAQTYSGLIADLPLRDLLQDKVGPLRMSTFFAVAMSPWYFKPLAGLLSDAFPLMGTRRKSYMILGAAVGGSLWLALGMGPRSYGSMLALAVMVNVGLVIISSATAGLLVEDGQRLGATGRLTVARIVMMSIAMVIGSVIGGVLAQHHQFVLTGILNAAIIFSLVPLVLLLLHEPKAATPDVGVLRNGWLAVRRLVSSGTMWAAAGMLFLVNLSPGFNTPLYDHLTHDLHFSRQFIGMLLSVSGAAGVLAALVYAWACRRFNLRSLLIASLALAALGAMPYLGLHSPATAIFAYAMSGFGAFMAQLAALDLATRAAPRGVEAMGYALMVSAYNISLNLSDVSGSWLWQHLNPHFAPLVFINAGTTLVVLLVVPFLPKRLIEGREGEIAR